jgi:hypothetical protein|tara:strand:- start:30 stop:458 length:429 start_codon:yes stop_codon:yes gene_type:complete
MASFTKVNNFVKNAVHDMDLESDQIAVALTNTAPGSESTDPTGDTGGVIANLTQISYSNCSSRNVGTTSSTQSGGTYKLVLQDLTLTASGTVGPFRYIYLFNDTVTGDPLIGLYDYGASVTLNNGDTFTLDFSPSNGVIQIA